MAKWQGDNLSVEIYGASHDKEIGVVFSGFPKEEFDGGAVRRLLLRRSAKAAVYSTPRREADEPVYLAGVACTPDFANNSCGAPGLNSAPCGTASVEKNIARANADASIRQKISADKTQNSAIKERLFLTGEAGKIVFYNKNVKSGDYNALYGKPRPSHADYAAYLKDGRLDFSGGGEFSGRLTAPLVAAGGIAKDLLLRRGVRVIAYVSRVGNAAGFTYRTASAEELLFALGGYETEIERDAAYFPAIRGKEAMLAEISAAKAEDDSVGGRVECACLGVPGGLGGALFSGLEGKISSLLYAIPAVKGVEFGDGFDFCKERGGEANDPITFQNGRIVTETNRAGGINGGIANGMPITLAAAFRPTPSIGKKQRTVDLVKKENCEIEISGRHDACIVPRAVAAVEAAVSLAILDEILTFEREKTQTDGGFRP